jgi:NADPH2:quinone reductase
VTTVKVGDRVAYAAAPLGAYSDARNYPAEKLVPIPEGVSEEAAAASLLKGLTAWYLVRRTFKVERGQTVLVHAARGRRGLILCQWLRHLGATTIGTVGSRRRPRPRARRAAPTRWSSMPATARAPARVKELTGGAKVPVVYDSIGKDTFDLSLECLAPFGLMVLFGASSGPVPPFDLQRLAAGGSLYVTRPTWAPTREARGLARRSARALRPHRQAGADHPREPALLASRGGASTPGPRGTEDDRLDGVVALSAYPPWRE